MTRESFDVLVIGASTGGPQALSRVLAGLPAWFEVPILIVQHMPPRFTAMLADRLARDSGRPCQEASHGDRIGAGQIYLAPGDFHLEIDNNAGQLVTRLTRDAPEHFCRPSVNPLFRTAARHYSAGVLALMLTGMGSDGLEGARCVVQAGGRLIAQDEATSVVWGMPGALVRHRLAHAVLPLDEIAPMIGRLSPLSEVAR